MAVALAVIALFVLVGAALWLAISALNQMKQLRRELDETQRQLNELKAAVEAVPVPPPPLPRTRSSGGLEDLREQLRAAHREEEEDASE